MTQGKELVQRETRSARGPWVVRERDVGMGIGHVEGILRGRGEHGALVNEKAQC